MKRPNRSNKIERQPVVSKWELWTVAQMLVTARGDDAEAHVEMKLNDARNQNDEVEEIIWVGVKTQLKRIRDENNS